MYIYNINVFCIFDLENDMNLVSKIPVYEQTVNYVLVTSQSKFGDIWQ